MKTIEKSVAALHSLPPLEATIKTIQNKKSSPLPFYKQIDGLRCFCVLGVLFQHFLDPQLANYFYSGNIGVDFFFVISGFLITENLIKLKTENNPKRALSIFYTRRILRIFPLYYLYLGLIILFYYEEVKSVIAWGLLYVVNFFFLANDNIPVAGHLWSLAVEEQFYLVWPFIILATPLHKLKACIVSLLVLSAVFIGLNFDVSNYHHLYLNTISCSISLLTGALLANLKRENAEKLTLSLPKAFWVVLPIAFLLFLICFGVKKGMVGNGFLFFLRPLVCVLAFYLIAKVTLQPFKGITSKILQNKAVMYIGRISYGIYIYHMIVYIVFEPIVSKIFNNVISLSLFDSGPLRYVKYNPTIVKFPFLALLVILVASISYELFESRFLKLKKRFAH